jgi:hypothetical protein
MFRSPPRFVRPFSRIPHESARPNDRKYNAARRTSREVCAWIDFVVQMKTQFPLVDESGEAYAIATTERTKEPGEAGDD